MSENLDQQWTKDLVNKLESLCDKDTNTIPDNTIGELSKEFIDCVGSYISKEKRQELYSQVNSILNQVKNLKIQTFKMGEDILKDNFIPDISVELHSVITQTEKSVEGILDVSDNIRKIADSSELSTNTKEDLIANSTKLLELCNFQDLTGQIIQRIIKRLTTIETTIGNIFHTLRQDPKVIITEIESAAKVDTLLNGPQSEGDRPSQEEIDDLFNRV